MTGRVKYGKMHTVNHERLADVMRGLVAGELKHPRFTKEEVAASKGTEHERLWSYILSLGSAGADAGRREGSTARTGANVAQIRGGLDRLGSLATRYGRDPGDVIAEKGRFFDRGAESRVYLEGNGGKVVKVRRLNAIDDDGAVDVLASIVYHNYLFPNDAYSLRDIAVWDDNGHDQFDLILEQPFVTPKTDANGYVIAPSEEQIFAALRKTPQRFSMWDEAWNREDYDEDSDGDFSSADFAPSARKIAYNGDFMVYDFKPGRNTFIDAATGEVRFIDPRVAINDPGMGLSVSRFGKRRIDRRGFDLPPSRTEDGTRFKSASSPRRRCS